MSAFFVGDDCLTKVVTAILRYTDTFGGEASFPCNASHIGSELRQMNAEALRQRYSDRFGDTELDYEFPGMAEAATPEALLKAVRCLHYQCAEGNVPETDPLFAELDKLSEAMLAAGVGGDGSPAYEAAPWGD